VIRFKNKDQREDAKIVKKNIFLNGMDGKKEVPGRNQVGEVVVKPAANAAGQLLEIRGGNND
jgi:hypothetical protein